MFGWASWTFEDFFAALLVGFDVFLGSQMILKWQNWTRERIVPGTPFDVELDKLLPTKDETLKTCLSSHLLNLAP